MALYKVSCMDVFAPSVRDIIQAVTPPDFKITFAETYDPAEQRSLIADADLLLVAGAPISGDMIRHAKRLKFIQKWGIGVDKIDLSAARQAGISVGITAGANAGPVAELAIGLMLAVYRRIPFSDKQLREGKWLKSEMRSWCYQLSGKTVGLFGFGAIARMVARRLAGFDVHILYHSRTRCDPAIERAYGVTYVPFEELLARSDILSIHTPLTEVTRHIVDRNAIDKMKNGAIMINTARGGIVDEDALYDAIVAGKLLGAGLDSYEDEPPSPDNKLLSLDRIVATPHCGGGVFDNVENVARHALGNMRKFVNAEPLAEQDAVPLQAIPSTV